MSLSTGEALIVFFVVTFVFLLLAYYFYENACNERGEGADGGEDGGGD